MILRIIIIVLALVGATSIAVIAYFGFIGNIIFGGDDPPKVEQTLASPDGAYNAIRVVSSGGGAAGWCREYVTIRPSTASDQILAYTDARKEVVFSTRCDSGQFSMQWGSDSRLFIKYRLPGDALADQELKDKDSSGKVLVHFEHQP